MRRLKATGQLNIKRPETDFSKQFVIIETPDMQKEELIENKKKTECCFKQQQGFDDSEKELDRLIGLESVKAEVRKLKLKLELQRKQEQLGIVGKNKCNMHMIFSGNPGTGKTTVARIITGILYNLNYIKENKCIEVGKQDIVGQYLGQSAQKANAVVEKALGGVLFIDEAYSLNENYLGDGFGRETIEVLLKAMEDNRDNLIVIFAGYTEDMEKFKKMNPGLKSRIGMTIEFPDYTSEELTQIFEKIARDSKYTLAKGVRTKVKEICSKAVTVKNFGNGRFVENLFREVEFEHAVNTKDLDAFNPKIMQILLEDIKEDFLDKIL